MNKYILLIAVTFGGQIRAEESCVCPKLVCGPCSIEQDVSFYTSKCGPKESRTRSCARPTCLPIEKPSKDCPNPPTTASGLQEPIVATEKIAKLDAAVNDARIVGTLKVISGPVVIQHAEGTQTNVTDDAKLRETDTVEAGPDATALINFEGGNRMHIHPNTIVHVKEYRDAQIAESRRALFNLVKGKIRNQVEQKYLGKTSYYKIQTRAAVAGVRGTDFIIEHTEGDKIETRVDTLSGKVTLASLDEHTKREIFRGEGATLTIDTLSKDYDVNDFIRRGKLSPVYRLPAGDLKQLDAGSRVDVARKSKSPPPLKPDVEICEGPRARFNQCAWRCMGNPKGEKRCQIEKPGVTCVRARCNANGQWADEIVLVKELAQDVCPANGFSVKPCDY